MQQRLTALYQLLQRYRGIWIESTYFNPQPSWLQQHPPLGQWLLGLTEQQVERYDGAQQQLLNDAAKLIPELKSLSPLADFDLRQHSLATPIRARQFAHIPGRKLEQISHFVAALPPYSGKLLEWCAGKGHLGRMFASQQACQITSLEYDQSLCDAGAELAQRSGHQQQFVCQDALTTAAGSHVESEQRAVALHACGDLHVSLLQLGVRKGTEQLAISPCCYHLTNNSCYQPLSATAKQFDLQLTRDQLRLAVLQTATAPQRVKRLRGTEVSYRLGLQWLLAQLGHSDKRLPSFGKQVLSSGFAGFIHWALPQLAVADAVSDELLVQAEQIGEHGWQRQRRLDLARQLFRPAIEAYLVLDRGLYLTENGYRVDIFRFCPAHLTPRNILIFAERRYADPNG
ncbi:methyltransferase [uncultured Ferrimonas sp.]|uniref:methyltransferase n=1 Tax=uncultured Ferrimonas sp. TaxID=432640 RepID=UPI0026325369|nr:methyltransferase [uncultured Ferrimonas sp.]